MSTFETLKADVESWTVRTDLPSNIYVLATEEINRRLRVRQMLKDYSATPSSETLALPSDFLEFEGVYVSTGGTRIPLTVTSEATIAAGHRSSGTPLEYAITGDNLILNPIPDGTYTLGGRYYAKLSDLSEDSDTNDILADFYALYLSAALSYAFGWVRDQEAEARWQGHFAEAISTANNEAQRAKYAGPIRMRPRASA